MMLFEQFRFVSSSLTSPGGTEECPNSIIQPAGADGATKGNSSGCIWKSLILRRSQPGASWGFSLASGAPDWLQAGISSTVFVVMVTRDSPAHLAGLLPGDGLLCVNGQDLSGASHNEAVEAFRRAKEPIIVQVVRQAAAPPNPTMAAAAPAATGKIPPPPLKPLPRVPQHDGAATCCRPPASQPSQHPVPGPGRCPTTSLDRLLQHVAPLQPTPPPVPPFPAQLLRCGLFSQASSSSEAKTPDAEDEFYNNVDEFDYEEVLLCRSSSSEKLGLTLCYSSVDGGSSESPTEVFVSEVDPGGIASASHRIRPGDQILRINGHQVRTRDQAVHLFSAGDRRVALLLARPSAANTGSDTGGSEDRSSSSSAAGGANLDELHLELMMLETPAEVIDEADEQIDEDDEEEANPDRHQDSGVSSTQSSEQEVEELAAALTRLGRHNSRSPSATQQRQQQQQQRSVPRMGTRLQRTSAHQNSQPPQTRQQPALATTLSQSNSRSTACQTVGTAAKEVEGLTEMSRRCQHSGRNLQQREQLLSMELSARCPAVPAASIGGPSSSSRSQHQQSQQLDQQQPQPQMEWVVKRRADGSRYVTRRPVRSRLLKARAAQVAEERAGLTTDDDAASCLGRWAPRHERKRHLLRTSRRLQQQQQQQQQQQHFEPTSVIFV